MLNSSHQIKTVDTSASPADVGDVDDDFVELLQVEQQAGKVTDDALARANAVHVRANDPVLAGPESGEGSIVIENLKLDMRRLFFGAVPVLKHVSSSIYFTCIHAIDFHSLAICTWYFTASSL